MSKEQRLQKLEKAPTGRQKAKNVIGIELNDGKYYRHKKEIPQTEYQALLQDPETQIILIKRVGVPIPSESEVDNA